MKTLGILAGLGPLAGAFFYKRLINLTPAASDQQHLKVILVSDPGVPSRTDHLLGCGPSPAPVLQSLACQLQEWGADVLAIPSVTTHAYFREISEAVTIPIINLLAEVGATLGRLDYHRAAFIATSATAQARLFDSYLPRGIETLYPDAATQHGIQELIDGVKGGCSLLSLRSQLASIACRPWASGASCLVLGCTELPLISPDEDLPIPLVSSTDVLAQAILTCSGLLD
jgi:aspartate racemase